MITFVLAGILVLAVGGCVCVVWAERGGPPWTRGVASATFVAGRVLRALLKSKGNRSSGGGSD
jgi:hypothetical protein